MTEVKFSLHISEEIQRFIGGKAAERGTTMSGYLRSIIEAEMRRDAMAEVTADHVPYELSLGVLSRMLPIPERVREVVAEDLEDGWFSDESDCLLHYIRMGMMAEGRSPVQHGCCNRWVCSERRDGL